jgi:hypothetical protein
MTKPAGTTPPRTPQGTADSEYSVETVAPRPPQAEDVS